MKYLLTMLAFCLFSIVNGQTGVTGKVLDPTGEPVIGTTVLLNNTAQGTVTDDDGMYRLEDLPAGEVTLSFSSVGYITQTQKVTVTSGMMSTLDVILRDDEKLLQELVVVAYGTKKKEDLTGSVTAVNSKDFQKGNITSPEQLLTGKVAGLQVTNTGGAAGGGSRIRIRSGASLNASNDPLLVIDGVPVQSKGPDGKELAGSTNMFNTINPNDIESISVLKDASATALYGSRASNGVIIVTTKSGMKGKPRFNFNTQVSLGTITKKVDVLSGDQVREFINKSGNDKYIKLMGKANTDWQDEIYQNAVGNDNNLSVSGSVGNLPYRVSVGYLNQDGILKTNHFNRLSGSIHLTPSFLDDHLKFTVAVRGVQTKNKFADEGAINAAATFDPTQSVNAKNNFGDYFEWLQDENTVLQLGTRNPVGLINLRDNQSTVNRLIGNVQVDYKLHFFPDLHVLANLGLDKSKGSGRDIISELSATNYQTKGRNTEYAQEMSNLLADLQLYYEKALGRNSKVDILAGHSYQDIYTLNNNFASYSADGNTIIPGTTPAFLTDKPQFRLESYLGRVNFNLFDKYLITASIRRDASSKFSPENRVGYFPALALAWKLKDELFANNQAVSSLKLRFGWGVTGQQDIGSYYSYLPKYSRSTETAQYQFGDKYYSFLRPSAYDENIKWETTTTTNLGLDWGFADERIFGSIDIYQKKTKDLLSVIPVAPGSNFDVSLLTNVGNMENRGIEFTVNTVPVKNDKLMWNFGFNVTLEESKITNLTRYDDKNFTGINVSGISGGTGNSIGKFAVDYAPYNFYVYKQVYDAKSGKPIEGLYEDLNRDGKIDDKDRYYYAKPAPDVLIGLATTVFIGNFNVGIAGHGSFGNYVYNNYYSNSGTTRQIEDPIGYIANVSSSIYESNFTNNQYLSDYYIENGSFFRLDNINLGYNFGRIFSDRAEFRINASVQNAFIITKYKGLDPELAGDSGVDNNIYPRPRIYSLGLNLDF
ncbi:MAG TPA: SusC/RagA family TonB-linked outer membrane protein [Saprospiraceae bacterium]|nr:SusC/RagA family TonB-linked outer membrane protein [Saprospiraceae bacterium]HQW55078.1 SusC/RagA family TonB-linked outer membrane protein [Saprospiraceae bacterium]